MEAINFFNAVSYLEPKCPKCSTVLQYGDNTRFDDQLNTHVCLKCGEVIR